MGIPIVNSLDATEQSGSRVTLLGGPSPVELQSKSEQETYDICIETLQSLSGNNKFVLGVGGSVIQIPIENLKAMFRATAIALNCGKVYAAGLDVVSTEPIKGDNPLLSAKNCIITPHISWAPKESRQRIMDCAVDNLKAYQAGSPINRVN